MRSFVLVFLTIVVSFFVMLGASLVLGWILILFLPFSLFEGTLLGMLAIISTFVIWHNLLRHSPQYGLDSDGFDVEPQEIPQSKFWKGNADRTWENWFRYMLANSGYEDFFISPHSAKATSEEYLRELSIHLADAGTEVLKRSHLMLTCFIQKLSFRPQCRNFLGWLHFLFTKGIPVL